MRLIHNTKADVVLLGREREGDENLALRYLAAALEKAGHRPHILPLCGPPDFSGAADLILRKDPVLVGLSISDGDMAIDALAFARYLRGRGYSGHLTCGGTLATLIRHELLERHQGIDSVIRHAGEVPIVELADILAAGKSLEGVPGMTTREGDGAPAPVADAMTCEVAR